MNKNTAPVVFGDFAPQTLATTKSVFAHNDNLFRVILNKDALWDDKKIDDIITMFPQGVIKEADLYLVLVECIANAAMHGKAEAFGIDVRRRGGVFLISLFHVPPLAQVVDRMIAQARSGWLPDYEKGETSGLGFPILFRIANRITVTSDRTRMQLWFKLRGT